MYSDDNIDTLKTENLFNTFKYLYISLKKTTCDYSGLTLQ